jgi:hypothetical protein
MTPEFVSVALVAVVFLAAIALVLSDFGKAVLLKWRELGRDRALHEDWQDLEADVDELIRAHLHVAQCQVRLAARIETAPKEFVEEILRAADLGYGVERAARKLAEKHGLWRPAALEYGERARPSIVPDAPPKSPIVWEEQKGDPPSEPPTIWDGDRLVPRRGA